MDVMAVNTNTPLILTVFLGLLLNCVIVSAKDEERTWKDKYDYIVVGGGVAGCVVAARLSEDADVNVLLLEAGKDDTLDPIVKVPRGFHTVSNTKAYDWGFYMEPQVMAGEGRRIRVNQARLLGGCGAHNAMNVIRGSPFDFDRWSELGNKGWSYKEVLEYFKKSEDMLDPELANNGYHGVGGPWQTKLVYRHPVVDEIINAGKELGYDEIDQNGPEEIGFSQTQNCVSKDGRRMSTAEAFLRPVLARRNLDVVLEAMVTKVAVEKCKSGAVSCKAKTKGVYFIKNKQEHFVGTSREVLVSGGTIMSPKILMLSGIGPKEHLEELKIDVVADLPVGKNFMDHIIVPMWFYLKPPEELKKKLRKVHDFTSLLEYVFKGTGPWASYASQASTVLMTDHQPKEDKFHYIEVPLSIEVFAMNQKLAANLRNNKTLDPKLVEEFQNFDNEQKYIATGPLLTHPRTNGTITLRSKDPFKLPKIDKLYFQHPDDIKDLLQGIRFIQKIMKTKVLQENVGVQPFKHRNENCWRLQYDTDEWWKCYIRHTSESSFSHYSSTCRMAPDHTGVVDDQLRVKGVTGLRVIDASIMPQIVSGHTMAATIMIAEKGSDMIKEARKQGDKNYKEEL